MHCDCSKAVREATAPLLAEIAELRDALSEARQANAELSRRAMGNEAGFLTKPFAPLFRRIPGLYPDDDHPLPPGEQWP